MKVHLWNDVNKVKGYLLYDPVDLFGAVVKASSVFDLVGKEY